MKMLTIVPSDSGFVAFELMVEIEVVVFAELVDFADLIEGLLRVLVIVRASTDLGLLQVLKQEQMKLSGFFAELVELSREILALLSVVIEDLEMKIVVGVLIVFLIDLILK